MILRWTVGEPSAGSIDQAVFGSPSRAGPGHARADVRVSGARRSRECGARMPGSTSSGWAPSLGRSTYCKARPVLVLHDGREGLTWSRLSETRTGLGETGPRGCVLPRREPVSERPAHVDASLRDANGRPRPRLSGMVWLSSSLDLDRAAVTPQRPNPRPLRPRRDAGSTRGLWPRSRLRCSSRPTSACRENPT